MMGEKPYYADAFARLYLADERQYSDKKYSIILADPPWTFRVWSKAGAGRTAASHYPVMKLEDICNLPVSEVAEDDSALFLWSVPPNLREAFTVIDAWGFTYKTVAFTWLKTNRDGTPFMGMGYYTRANAELCLLATRGKVLPRNSRSVRQVIISPRREHSRKPDEQYRRIEELFGKLPRIELFARYTRPGWDAWGNEIVVIKGDGDVRVEQTALWEGRE